jgi:DNA-binding SARP family transcriptional activator/predicted ATPase
MCGIEMVQHMLVKKWDVRLLGAVDASSGASGIGRFATRHTAILFAYLCRNAGRRVTRDQLVDLLWPDVDLVTGRTRLRVALVSLRKRLEPLGTNPGTVLLSDRDAITLRSEACDIDANRFRQLVTQGLCATASNHAMSLLKESDLLYRGPFCAGIDHEWIEQERESLVSAHISAQLELSNLFLAQDDFPAAVSHARKAAESDPLSEPARQALMTALMFQGSKDAAVLEYKDFSRTLDVEIGASPSVPTTEILTRVVPRVAALNKDFISIQNANPGASLPKFFDEYIQRDGEFELLEELGLTSRVVNLQGPVGIGKTRLAIEYGWHLLDRGTARTWFAAARPNEKRSLPEFILSEIGSNSSSEDPAAELRRITLRESTVEGSGRVIVIIDDAHNLGPNLKVQLRDLLKRIPGIHFLLISRGTLSITGAQEYQVGPLELPQLGLPHHSELGLNASVRLFLSRARAVHPEFHLTSGNAQDLAKLCCALEGIPLALELAASQVRKNPLPTLTEKVFSTGPHDRESWRHPRHRTLNSAFRVIRDSLSAEDVESLSVLTIFEGSWTVEAANAVLLDQDSQAVLDRLVSHALVVMESSFSGVRYKLWGSVKQFASQDIAAETFIKARRRHARYFLQVARTFAAGVGQGGFNFKMVSHLDRDNLDAGLSHLLDDPKTHLEAVIMAGALTWYWIFTGTTSLGFKAISSIKPLLQDADNTMTSRLLISEGLLECFGLVPFRAIDLLSSNVNRLEASGDPWLQGYARWGLGLATYLVGEYEVAKREVELANHLFIDLGSDWWSACCRHLLGSTLLALGDVEAAKGRFQQSIDLWHECGDRYLSVASHMGLARVAWVEGHFESSRRNYLECFEVYRSSGDVRMATFCLQGLARVACSAEHFVESARLFGLAERTREDHALQLDLTDSAAESNCVTLLRAQLSENFDRQWTLGRSAI